MPERDRFHAVYSIYEEVMDSQSTAEYGWRLVFDIWTALKAPRSKQLGALFLLHRQASRSRGIGVAVAAACRAHWCRAMQHRLAAHGYCCVQPC
jgi:hypothetical protein